MKLSELTTIKQEECPVCISYVYNLPCRVDDRLFERLRIFGREKYSVVLISLFKIEEDQFYVECVAESKQAKIWFKKTMAETEIEHRVNIFEECLREWLSDVFDSDIEKG